MVRRSVRSSLHTGHKSGVIRQSLSRPLLHGSSATSSYTMKQHCSSVAIVVLSLLLVVLPSAMSSNRTIEANLTAEKCAAMPRWWPMNEVAQSLTMKPRMLKEQPHICTEKGTKKKVPDEYLGWYAFYLPGSSPEDPKPDYGPTTLLTWVKLCSYG